VDGLTANAPPDLLGTLRLPRVPQQQRSREKRDRVLEAALALFSERGYERTNVEDIAARAGVSVGTLYAYFRNKQQILIALVGARFEQVLALGVSDLASRPRVLSAIEALVRRVLVSGREAAGLRRAWREAAALDPEIARHDREAWEWRQARLTAALERAREAGWSRPDIDSESLAVAIIAMLSRLSEMPEADEAVAGAVARMLYHAVFPDRR
jgi:AcrR family transcriptional regulator